MNHSFKVFRKERSFSFNITFGSGCKWTWSRNVSPYGLPLLHSLTIDQASKIKTESTTPCSLNALIKWLSLVRLSSCKEPGVVVFHTNLLLGRRSSATNDATRFGISLFSLFGSWIPLLKTITRLSPWLFWILWRSSRAFSAQSYGGGLYVSLVWVSCPYPASYEIDQ